MTKANTHRSWKVCIASCTASSHRWSASPYGPGAPKTSRSSSCATDSPSSTANATGHPSPTTTAPCSAQLARHSPGPAATDGSSHPTLSFAGTAVAGLGHTVGASTVWRILKHHRIDPAPQRSTVTWTQFLRSQAAVACDFATVDTALLRRYYLLFFIDINSREVFFAGITANPSGRWTTQAARTLFLCHADRFSDSRAIVRDRGSQFIDTFDEIFRTEGLKVLKTPIRTPVADTFAERWIGTLRRELLDHTIIWNQRQLERLVTDYIDYYNTHRPHRSLDQRPPRDSDLRESARPDPAQLRIVRSTRCDGLINEYRNAA